MNVEPDDSPHKQRPNRAVLIRFVIVGLVMPVIFCGFSTALQMMWIPRLPDPIAIHWGISGKPDGYGTMWTPFIGTLLCALVLPCLMALQVFKGIRRGDVGPTYRFAAAASAGFSAFFATLFAWTTGMQTDIASWRESPSVLPALVGALVVAVVVGIGGWLIQPAVTEHAARYRKVEPITLRRDERVAWLASTTMSRLSMTILLTVLTGLGVGAVAAWMVGTESTAWLLTGTAVLVAILIATSAAFHVHVDKTGLLVHSVAGFPKFRVPLAQITEVAVTDVNPIGQFGGLGLRKARGKFGVILHAGEALVVTRTNGRQFVVTVDGAASAAELLEALVRREKEKRADGRR